jgi:nucleotide-binding universal stress UspA family protein
MKDKIRILVGIDGSDHSLWALLEAINIVRKSSGFLKVITVYKQGKKEEAEKIRQKTQQYLEKEKIDYELATILGSNPSRALVNTARNENFDLIVVGSRGLGSTASFLLGSISKQVVTKAHCDVLVIKK